MLRFLVLLLIFGSMQSPALQAELTSLAPSDNNDYGDYVDENDQNAAPSHLESTLMPYFDKNETTVYAQPNTTVKLDCPVKNYNATHHVILWFKENTTITNGNKPIQDIYRVDNQFSLIIDPISNMTYGNYSCSIMPHKVRTQISVKYGDPPITLVTSASSRIIILSTLLSFMFIGISVMNN